MNTNNEGWNTEQFQQLRLEKIGINIGSWGWSMEEKEATVHKALILWKQKMISEEYLYIHGIYLQPIYNVYNWERKRNYSILGLELFY